MKATLRTLLALLLMSAALASAGADEGAKPSVTATADRIAFYQFDGDRLLELPLQDDVVEARIEYELDGRTLRTLRFLLNVAAGETVTFPVPDPTELPQAAHGSGKLAIHVYVGDLLLESFDAASFRQYDRKLIRSQGAELERHLEAWSEEPDAPLKGGPAVEAAPPTFEVASDLGAKLLFGGCEDDCRAEYRQCIRYTPSASCDNGLYWCLLSCPDYDSDSDGVANGSDNCLQTYNPGQANCDGDSAGDACDTDNGTWQTIIPEKTCWTDKDTHIPIIYFSFEHHVEHLERDVSNCNNPDRWRNRIRDKNNCYNIPDEICCLGLSASIQAVGDSAIFWCDDYHRDVNICH